MKVAVIRIRGTVKVRQDMKDTLKMLGLEKNNACIVVELTPILKGMIHKVKDYVTFGELSEHVAKELEEKRGKTSIKKESKTIYFLSPPKGGFEKKGIKKTFVQGGALGDRKEKINDLIQRMV